MAGTPMVLPVQDSSVGRWTTWKVERIVPGPDFQLKLVPGCTGPLAVAALISGFQSGQRPMSAITSQTVSGSAATSTSPVANTGALVSACTGSLLVLQLQRRTTSYRPGWARCWMAAAASRNSGWLMAAWNAWGLA